MARYVDDGDDVNGDITLTIFISYSSLFKVTSQSSFHKSHFNDDDGVNHSLYYHDDDNNDVDDV